MSAIKKVQQYILHLSNGDNVTVEDEYYGENEYFLPEKIAKAKDYETFWFGDYINGFSLIPKRSIVYITMGSCRTEAVNNDPFETDPAFAEEAAALNA